LSGSLREFIIWRFLAGIAIGGSSVLAPVYLAEIAQAERRGALVGMFQVNIVVGILSAYGSNFCVARFLSGTDVWRYKLAMAALPALLFSGLMFTIPQSPRWLVLKGRLAQAEASLRRLGSTDPQVQMAEYRAGREDQGGARQRLSWRAHRAPILLAIGLACFNQLSGINAILYYLGDIFAAAGFSGVSADAQAVAVGATNLIATLFGMSLIDRLGRKKLLLSGAIGMAVALCGVSLVMANLAPRGALLLLLIAFIASFALSQGAVIWVYLSEIFPTAVRARGQSLGSAAHWLLNALISGIFPVIAAHSEAAPFVFFSAMMLLQFIIVWCLFPETRGVPLEGIAALLQRRRSVSADTQRSD